MTAKKTSTKSTVHYQNMINDRFNSDPKNYYIPFVCGNDGIAVKSEGNTVCFCPPNSYGNYCQYSSD
ncbi:hypothetical protein I4U23_015121 [Adineta vaga]|nr:hypothetical protein I4U23_015121 [Adineta vaga]